MTRDWADLDNGSIRTFDQRKNVRLLRDLLWTGIGETILAVAHARDPDSRARSGLLAVTSKRVVFVNERITKPPFVLSIAFDSILSIGLAEQPMTGTLTLATKEGSTVFDLIRPKERTWPLYWRISERIGQLPLRGHS